MGDLLTPLMSLILLWTRDQSKTVLISFYLSNKILLPIRDRLQNCSCTLPLPWILTIYRTLSSYALPTFENKRDKSLLLNIDFLV